MSGRGLSILVYGYGNPGRQDDGVGIALVDSLESMGLEGVHCERNYQLNVEDALEISRHDAVIFVDASIGGAEPFEFTEVTPSRDISFTTHAMEAASVLALCEELYGKSIRSFMCGVRGYEWEAGEPLSGEAAVNFEKALMFLSNILRKRSIEALEEAALSGRRCIS